MGFGIRRGGQLKPLFKWDGRNGVFHAEDHVNGQKQQRDVTRDLVCVFDLTHMEQGHIRFPKGAPPETILFPMDASEAEIIAAAPKGEGWGIGLRVCVKLPLEDQWRECLSTTMGLWNALGILHDQYLERADLRGLLPVASLVEVKQIVGKNAITFEPVFCITHWINPDDVLTLEEPEPEPKPKPTAKPQRTAATKAAAKHSDMDDDEIPFS